MITLKFFGPLRELTKLDEVEIEIQENARVEDLVGLVGEQYPGIRDHLKVVSFSVGNEYAPKGTKLKDGDTVGLLPPISGG